jgi:hypothetical protein
MSFLVDAATAYEIVAQGIYLIAYHCDTNTLHCGYCKAELVGIVTHYRYTRPPHCICNAVPPPCEATAAPEVIEDE